MDMEKRDELLRGKLVRLPDVLVGKASARDDDSQVTGFTNEGTGVQFAAVAMKVYEEAKKRKLGREVPLEWFLQDIPN